MSSPSPLTVLHLSDLQFGKNHRFGRLSVEDESFDSLFARLSRDLEQLRKSQNLTPDLIAVTGDLAEWGKKVEFEDVFTFLDRMGDFLALPRNRILVVPGNHDINRKACESYFADCEADDEPPKEPYWPKLRHYKQFFEKYYTGVPGFLFTETEPWSLFEIQELNVVVAGLNSTMKESHRPADHYGWVGERQLRWFAEKLQPYKKRGWLRIGLVHHNVKRRATQDEENLHDADDLERILGKELNLLLHGHTHQGRIDWLGPSLPVLSTGSASVALAARPQEVPNQYQVIRLYPDRIWNGTRQYAPDQKRWIGDTRVSPTGDQWSHEERVSFEGIDGTFSQRSPLAIAPTDYLAKLVEGYRLHVAVSFRRQPLHDLCTQAEDQDIPGGLALLDIFVPQAVNLAPPPKDLPRGMVSEDLGDDILGDEETKLSFSWGESPPIPVEQVLLDPNKPWVFLLGAPGAGKTSLTRWLCLKLCTPGESLPNLPSELVPVRVEMRRFDDRYRAATAAGRTYDFYDYLDQEHAEKALALRGGQLRTLGESGRLVWLFDGIDEVADPIARKRYAEMIVGRSTAESCRGVITSRIVGAQPVLPIIQAAGIPVCTLLDFDEPRIHEFISRWHQKAFRPASDESAARKVRLERAIAESRSIRDLCKNPLLLTMIALLNRGGELPRRRHQLYRRAIELMATQWEANKQLPQRAEFRFEQEDKIEFLRELAWRMLELPDGSRNLIHEEELLAFTSHFLQERHGRTPEQARRYADILISHLRERNYILARIGEQLFGFVHKTFLEYLVADSIRSRFASGQLTHAALDDFFHQLWADDSWHEVLTLICALLEEDGPENVMKVLQALLPRIEIFPDYEVQFAGFAIRCLAEVRQLDREPIRSFMLHLASLAQHGMARVAFIQNHDAVANSIHLIGPRWPARDNWLAWRNQGLRRPGARLLANWCVLGTIPVEKPEALLGYLLRNERSPSVAHHTLAKADLPAERISQMLVEGDEGLRCAVAGGLLYRTLGIPLYQRAFTEEACTTLQKLLATSQDASIRVRAAAALAEAKPDHKVRETLLACVKSPSSTILDLVDSIHALGHLARAAPEIVGDLRAITSCPQRVAVGLPLADALIRASRFKDAAESILEWINESYGYEVRNRIVEKLGTCACSDSQVTRLLERLCTDGETEAMRTIASHACDEAIARQELERLSGKPLADLLAAMEAPTTPEFLRARLPGQLLDVVFTEQDSRLALGVLRRMVAADYSPASRLAAAENMCAVAFGLEDEPIIQEESRSVYRELVNSSADEKVRIRAARRLCEEGRDVIESLASNSTNEEVRFLAGIAQKSLSLRDALGGVGRES